MRQSLAFDLSDDGYLYHVGQEKCVKPVSDKITDGVELAIYEDCDVNHRFGMTKGGSLRHLGSGKCIQPADEVLISLCNCVCA